MRRRRQVEEGRREDEEREGREMCVCVCMRMEWIYGVVGLTYLFNYEIPGPFFFISFLS